MALTDFGRALRVARASTDATMSELAGFLNKSASYLSAVETGQRKVTDDLVEGVYRFFEAKKYTFDKDLKVLASVANQNVELDGLKPKHQMLVASLARANLDAEALVQLTEFLEAINNKEVAHV